MMAEGLIDEALVLTRVIHERYHATKRNPFNEIECGDHYARAMASHGTFITACGFEYHGPKGFIRFAPRLSPDNFKSAFTAAGAWGTFHQRRTQRMTKAKIKVIFGTLRLKILELELSGKYARRSLTIELSGRKIPCHFSLSQGLLRIEFQDPVIIGKQEELLLKIYKSSERP
jgi:hypothetical protein